MAVINPDENKNKAWQIYNYDICIIGSGPAGLTLCSELYKKYKNSNKKICVIESGDKFKRNEIDSLKEVKSDGEIKIRNSSRERMFGGTSNTWAGLSSPMDKIDIEKWPISYDELYKYYSVAHEYGFPNISEFSREKMKSVIDIADYQMESDNLSEKIFIAKDPAWNFARELGYIFENKNFDLYLNSTVTKIESKKNAATSSVSAIKIKTLSGNTFDISASKYVISAGGIESARLLLVSKNQDGVSLGNEFDQVGRYITNHPKNNYGIIKLNKPIKNLTYIFGYLDQGFAKSAGIRVNENLQKKLGILNSYVRFEPIFPWTDNKGVSSFVNSVKTFKFFLDWWKRNQKKIVSLRDWSETGDDNSTQRLSNGLNDLFIYFKNIITDLPAVFSYIIHRIFQSKKITIKSIRLRNFMDMEARYENRIVLDTAVDRNGIQIPRIILNISEIDRNSVIELHRVINEELVARNIGVLESDLKSQKTWPINSEASHHLGGTIMGNDKEKSVVDKNLKVHSVDNLYICSGSVFPTSGCANPTYTICALAIRLAEYLGK